MTGQKNKRSFYTIISFSFPRLINGSYNIIASSHYTDNSLDPYNITPDMLAKRLDLLFNIPLKIIYINSKFKKVNINKIGNSINKKFSVIDIPSELFFKKDVIEKILIQNKKIHHFIFVFKNLDYREIVFKLAHFNIIISGGSNNKKHILSPIQLRLARFLIAFLPLTGPIVANSFHSNREGKSSTIDYTSKEAKEFIAQRNEILPKNDSFLD